MSNGEDFTQGSDLTIPEDRIRRLEQVVSERNRIQALIKKAEDGKGKVKEDIYLKVISDYEAKMSAVASSYEPVRAEISDHLRRIRAEEMRIRTLLGSIQDEIEELKFRCDVGEFGPDELAARENEKRVRAQAFQEQVGMIESTYAKCRSFLGEDDFADAIEPAGRAEPAGEPGGMVPDAYSNAPPPPPPPMDVEIVQPPHSNPDVTLDGLMPLDFDLPPAAGEDLMVHGGGRTTPPARPSAPPPPTPPISYNPEVTLSEPIPDPARPAGFDSTLDGGPVPGAPKSQDVEATLSFQHRCLLVLQKEGGGQDTFLLGMQPLSIGRNHRNDVVLLDRSISRKHAEVKKEPEGYVMQDMSSGGGISVNGEKKKRTVLKNNDEILIGDFKLFFREEMGF